MTKIQRTILEQAYVNVLVDSVQQGDSWGYIDIRVGLEFWRRQFPASSFRLIRWEPEEVK